MTDYEKNIEEVKTLLKAGTITPEYYAEMIAHINKEHGIAEDTCAESSAVSIDEPPVDNAPPSVSGASSVKIRVAVGGKEVGEFERDEIIRKIQSGEIKKDAKFWQSGMDDWIKAGEHPAFEKYFPEEVLPIENEPPVKIGKLTLVDEGIKYLKYNDIKFDDYSYSKEKSSTQVCSAHSKLFDGSMLSPLKDYDAICGVKGCRNDAHFKIDFIQKHNCIKEDTGAESSAVSTEEPPEFIPKPIAPISKPAAISAADVEQKLEEAMKHYENKDYNKAIPIFLNLAKQGNARAQLKLGSYLTSGEGFFWKFGEERDLAEAVKWYRKAAEQGNARAQNSLGNCYHLGRGVPKDYTEAAKWFRKAAEQGNALAQNSLGFCYYFGEGVPKDYAEAAKWYRKAAEQGNGSAQEALKSLKREGKI